MHPDKSQGSALLNLDPSRPSTVRLPAPAPLAWRSARVDDGPAIAEIRALVLQASLERLGRYDEVRVRKRFLASFAPGHTLVLQRSTELVGSIAVRPAADGAWIEHFYLHSAFQGRGLGSLVMNSLTSAADAAASTLRLNVLQFSDARRLYERHGFSLDHEDSVDVYLRRLPNAS